MNCGKERQDYLFINKNSGESPPNKFTRDETRRRNQFLQKGRRHTYPETIFQPSRKGRTRATKKSKPRSWQDYSNNHQHVLDGRLTNHSNNRENGYDYQRDTYQHVLGGKGESIFHHDDISTTVQKPQLAFSNSVDPFGSAVVHMDADTCRLLQYYRLAWHPSIWFIETQLSTERTTKHLAAAATSVQDALHDRLQLLALLATSASRLENIVQRSGQMTHVLVNNALKELRSFLSQNSVDDPNVHQYLFKILAYLMTADGFSSDFAAAQVHVDTAIALTQYVGGVSGVRCVETRDLLMKIIVSIHSFTFKPCKVDLQGCFLPSRQLNTPEALRFVKEHAHGQEIPVSFRSFLSKHHSCSGVAPTIQAISSCSRVLDAMTRAKPCKAATAEVARWLYHSDITIRHQLLNLECPNEKSDFLRIGLLMWVTATLTSLGPTPIAAVMSENLRDRLGNQQFVSWAPTPEVGLWILTLGAMFAAEDSDTEVWFVQKIYQVDTTLGLISVSSHERSSGLADRSAHYLAYLEQFQNTAFYTAKAQAGLLRRLAQVLAEIEPT